MIIIDRAIILLSHPRQKAENRRSIARSLLMLGIPFSLSRVCELVSWAYYRDRAKLPKEIPEGAAPTYTRVLLSPKYLPTSPRFS